MTRKFYAMTPDGARLLDDVTEIRVSIQGDQFQFAIHPRLNRLPGLTVSHWQSGMKATDIDPGTLAACLGDKKAAARLALGKLAEKVGEARLRSVLAGAKPIEAPAA